MHWAKQSCEEKKHGVSFAFSSLQYPLPAYTHTDTLVKVSAVFAQATALLEIFPSHQVLEAADMSTANVSSHLVSRLRRLRRDVCPRCPHVIPGWKDVYKRVVRNVQLSCNEALLDWPGQRAGTRGRCARVHVSVCVIACVWAIWRGWTLPVAAIAVQQRRCYKSLMWILDAESTCICYALRMFYFCFTWFRDLEFYAVVAALFGHLAIQFAPDFYYAEDLKSYVLGPLLMLGLLDIVAFSMEEHMNYYLRSSYELVTWFGQHVTLRGYVVCVCVYMFFSYFQLFVCLWVFVVRTCMLIIFSCFVHWASRCGGVVDFKGWIEHPFGALKSAAVSFPEWNV